MTTHQLAARNLFGEGAEYAINKGQLVRSQRPVSEAEWAAAVVAAQAAQDQVAVNEKLLTDLSAAYTDFSDGGKWAFGSAYDTVVNHIRRGDIAAAKLTVQMVQIPDEVPGVPSAELATWTAKKAEILALFP
ncbi:hypothetical protein UFOVP930_63 [uncultured Caudovirales phage]|uniref:Uncharacterized protein n=1 Tax=uncultured Caudovirales phage TaxID=2100421 RepID=A0A6J7XW04_9CAUD|nr:hypothetical protein UFOVP930_63 [uncultured Caudovirales phage]CAB4199681.1 hypothetical protein UFOVP1354_3 [uncultured Caudovirales phage]CAB5238566.1 hypothetical protein UFOVP1547_52 [uncultured Caudovirales phage]